MRRSLEQSVANTRELRTALHLSATDDRMLENGNALRSLEKAARELQRVAVGLQNVSKHVTQADRMQAKKG